MKFKITRSIKAQQKLSRDLIRQGKTIAVVPTMGYFHEGHLSLIRRASKLADIVVTTIFVNPAQFAPHEDLKRYPRDTKGDIRKIKEAGGQAVFIPRAEDIYPDEYDTWVMVEKLTQTLEGKARPTHFCGVATIVSKLFNIIQPDIALFGMKDYQQAMVLKKMTADLNWAIKIIICPTVREKDGLAMSSRNSYLPPAQRKEALALYESLVAARKMIRDGVHDTVIIKRHMQQVIKTTAPSAKIDYIAFTEMESLKPLKNVVKNTVISLAVWIGTVRLIDNVRV